MTATERDGTLIIYLEGRIDTNNALRTEQEITGAMSAHEGLPVCFDAGKLTYLSSAGLRVLMKVRKEAGYPVSVINVSRDVYDIFETTGFTELLDVKKAYRTISVEGLPVIGRGFFGTVYRMDNETIVKMYHGEGSVPMIENEKKMAQKAFLAGIPTAISYDIVKAGEDYGSVFELLNARTFHELAQTEEMPLDELIRRYTDLLKLVHHTEMKSGEFPSCRERFLEYLDVIKVHLDEAQYEGLKRLLVKMPEEYTVVHGDIQMKNVMLSGDEAMLIGMDTMGTGNPVFEFAGLYVTYRSFEEDDPANSMAFLSMPGEMVNEIWNRITEAYFAFPDDAARTRVLEKIRLAAAIRFLYILESTNLKNNEFGERRIAHTREHIDDLLKTVDSFEL